jgi:hypothetical protein
MGMPFQGIWFDMLTTNGLVLCKNPTSS